MYDVPIFFPYFLIKNQQPWPPKNGHLRRAQRLALPHQDATLVAACQVSPDIYAGFI
jgi:hypothetical protein